MVSLLKEKSATTKISTKFKGKTFLTLSRYTPTIYQRTKEK